MIFCILCLLLTLFRSVVLLDFSAATPDNFGPYAAKYHHYQVCRGPKSKNDTLFETELKTDGESYGANFNLTVYTATCRFENIKISLYTVKDGVKLSLLWSYKLENPCQHVVIDNMLDTKLGVKNCLLKKGFYQTYINFASLAHDFLGKSFFYGEFLFKAIMLSKTGNIGCVTFYTVFTKAV